MDDNKEEIKPMKSKETSLQSPSDIFKARPNIISLKRFPSLQNIREIYCSNKVEPSYGISEAKKECRYPRLNSFLKSKSNVCSWVSFESREELRQQKVPDGSAQSNMDDQPNEMLKHLVSIADSITYNGLELQDPSGKMHHYFDAYLPPYLEDEAA